MCLNYGKYCMNKHAGANGYCNYCEKEGYAGAKQVKEPYKIPKESKKRAKENREYKKKRDEKLKLYPVCEMGLPGCTVKATDTHHVGGRVGKNLTGSELLSCCRNCHTIVELNPKMAKEKNFSKSRLIKN
jgi:hypothetical protein